MENLFIAETNRTPAINLDYQKGILTFEGSRCMPETAMIFFNPVVNWVSEYVKKNANKTTQIIFKLGYYNTSSSKTFIDIFKMLEGLAVKGQEVVLRWFYDESDEDMAQNADDMQASLPYIKVEKVVKKEDWF